MFQNIFRNMPPVVKNLLIINLLVFLLTVVLENQGTYLIRELGLYYPASAYFKPFQIVTSMFTHANLPHLFFNMFALLMFGATLEKVWGPKKFLLFYFITGVGAALCHVGVQAIEFYNAAGQLSFGFDVFMDGSMSVSRDVAAQTLEGISTSEAKTISSILFTPTVGASGAVFGILIGFAMLFPNTELMMLFLPIPIKAKYFIGFYVVLELFLGLNNFEMDSIAHFAHLGGALFGFIMVKIWSKNRNQFY
jgi:membrane associated rhomboid family serine protease